MGIGRPKVDGTKCNHCGSELIVGFNITKNRHDRRNFICSACKAIFYDGKRRRSEKVKPIIRQTKIKMEKVIDDSHPCDYYFFNKESEYE